MKPEISDFLIEQLYLDEVDPELKRQLLADSDVVRRLENLRKSNAEILEAYPAALMAERIEARLKAVETAEANEQPPAVSAADSRPGSLRRLVQWRGFYPALAAAAVLALVIGMLPLLTHGGIGTANDSGIRVKGAGPVIHVYRETSDGAELLKEGATAGVHDLLQLSYVASGAEFGVIFSIDGSGTVTLHFPESSRSAAHLEKSGEIALPYSYELDNAPGFERFYFVTSTKEFPVEEILGIARKAATSGRSANLSLPAGFRVASFTVNKGTKR